MSNTITSTEYLTYVVEHAHTNPFVQKQTRTFHAAFLEVAKLELIKRGEKSEPFDYAQLKPALDRINNREDCAEFAIPGIVRILKEYRDLLDQSVIEEIEQALIGFRYWLDEAGEINACYFSENHQPLYHSAEILAGDLFPDTVFPSNGKDGKWHAEHGKTMIRRWIDWRTRFGFSEWTCNYYMEDIIPLLGLIHYCGDKEIAKRSRLLVDTLLFDIAVNTFEGHWIGSKGRTYPRYLVDSRFDGSNPICKLYFGEGDLDGDIADCAIMLAVYDYQCPEAIAKAGQDMSEVLISKQRMSINTADAKAYGIDPKDFDNIMFFWGLQVYDAREVVENSTKVMTPTNWMNERFNAYKEKYELCDKAGIPTDDDPDFTAMTQADIYVYKTPDYAMSTAQDFRKGKQGYQQHPWGATLGGRAVVYTNHPGSLEYFDRPNMLAGNWVLPRAVQHENVALCIYRVPADCIRMLETHAYFPQHEFDEVIQKDGWVFGRKNNAYVALKSLIPAVWKDVDPNMYKAIYGDNWETYCKDAKPCFYHANGHANVWVCEMGSKAQNGSFDAFMSGFDQAAFAGDTFGVTYQSPSVGTMTFGWNEPLTVNGEEIAIHDYLRYDNPFCKAEFDTVAMTISCGDSNYVIDHKA